MYHLQGENTLKPNRQRGYFYPIGGMIANKVEKFTILGNKRGCPESGQPLNIMTSSWY